VRPNVKLSKPTNRRFKKGISSNPSGRPFGTQNKSTRLGEQLLEGATENLSGVLLEFALNGNIHALRTVNARLVRMAAQALAILEGNA
jgi:Family of unknown function (DUF5681)